MHHITRMNKALALSVPVLLAVLAVTILFFVSALTDRQKLQQQTQRLSAEVARLQNEAAQFSALTNATGNAELASPQIAKLSGNTPSLNAQAPSPSSRERDGVRGHVESGVATSPTNSQASTTQSVKSPSDPVADAPVAAISLQPSNPEPQVVQVAAAAGSSTNAPLPRPYQVRVFLGKSYVGKAWVVPSNLRKDADTGRVAYEPIVHLPEDARSALTAYVTNVVETPVPVGPQVVEREVYVEPQPYFWGVPQYVPVPVGRYRNRHQQSPPPVPPARPMPQGSAILKPQGPGDPGFYVPPFNR